MADRAGDAIFIELAIDGGAFRECSREQRDWVMAAFTVSRVFDPLFRCEQCGVFDVPRSAEGVSVSGLAPFGVCLLMAVTAVFGGREGFRVDELTSVRRCIRRQEWFVLSESKIVVLFDRLGVDLPLSGSCHGVGGVGSVPL